MIPDWKFDARIYLQNIMVQKVEGHRQTVDFENERRKIWVNLINRHLFLPHLQMFVVIFNLKIEKKKTAFFHFRGLKNVTQIEEMERIAVKQLAAGTVFSSDIIRI